MYEILNGGTFIGECNTLNEAINLLADYIKEDIQEGIEPDYTICMRNGEIYNFCKE